MTAAVEPGPSLEDGVIVEARHVDDEQAGFGQVRFSDRVHVCQYVFVDGRGSVQAPDSPGRVSCQWRRHALETPTRHARLRALDLAGMQLLQTLFDAARVHGAEVRLTPVAVPAYWDGPAFTRGPDVATVLEAQADSGRPTRAASLA